MWRAEVPGVGIEPTRVFWTFGFQVRTGPATYSDRARLFEGFSGPRPRSSDVLTVVPVRSGQSSGPSICPRSGVRAVVRDHHAGPHIRRSFKSGFDIGDESFKLRREIDFR